MNINKYQEMIILFDNLENFENAYFAKNLKWPIPIGLGSLR